MREVKLYSPAKRHLVEVLVDGTWYPGELRAWFPAGEDEWTANVTWTCEDGSRFLTTVPVTQVRPG